MEKIFVVTNPENGWDCVHCTVYKGYTEEEVRELLNEEFERDTEDDFIIHEIYELIEKQ